MAFGRPLLIVLASLVDPSLADVKASDRQPIDASDPPHCDRASSCPSYGCPLLPRDVIYDKEANAALEVLFGKGENDNDDEYPNTARVMQELESSGSENAVTLTLVGYKGGRLEDQINQDRAFIISPFRIPPATSDSSTDVCIARDDLFTEEHSFGDQARLLGVFDGHDKHGEIVSEYATKTVPKLISRKLALQKERESQDGVWTEEKRIQETKQILTDSFLEADRVGRAELDIPRGGCTASVILQIGPMLYVANTGDSRSIIATYSETTEQIEVVYTSREDKPDLPDERKRVEGSGGIVRTRGSGDPYRVYYVDPDGQQQGGLAMSRALGDWDLRDKGVIPDPIVDVLDVNDLVVANKAICGADNADEDKARDGDENDKLEGTCSAANTTDEADIRVFAISATDGMTDFLTPEGVASAIGSSLFGNKEESRDNETVQQSNLFAASFKLIIQAANSWQQAYEGKYRDDIAIAASIIKM